MSALPDDLRLGPVHVAVTDLGRSVAFYERSIGLVERERANGTAALGTGRGEDVLVLHEEPGARPPGRHAGLYHFALLHPSRLELGQAARRLAMTGTPISGASDHGISDAIYLPDPDGNGIELAADRPRADWPSPKGVTAVAPMPLDLDALIAATASPEPSARVDPGLVVGHLHLHVGDVDRAVAFCCDVVGFEAMTLLPTAAFVAAGDYHHHLGLNTWRGKGVPPAPPDAVGLRLWTIHAGDGVEAARERVEAAGIVHEERDGGFVVRDPWENALLVTT